MKVMHFQSAASPASRRRVCSGLSPAIGPSSGVALVVTLILLAVITFMAIAFLVLSHRERSSVSTTTDQALARQAADAGTEWTLANIATAMLSSGNPYRIAYAVSTNYGNPAGFARDVLSPTNVNYEVAATMGLQQQLVNLNNLLYSPRPPVFITNRLAGAAGSNEFRYYLDLNRNGRFDPSGWVVVTNAGQPVRDASGNPLFTWVQGDPQWVGGLEFPSRAHSGDNRFLWRYATAVVPISETLDINYIHNQAFNPAKRTILTTGEDYRRNQGVGTWEINLASFLYDLNTNIWGGRYYYQPLNNYVSGNAFEDACSILVNRYGGINYAASLGTVANLYWANGRRAFQDDYIDGYSAGPIMTNFAAFRFDPDVPGTGPDRTVQPFPGADNTNHFFSLQDLFDPAKTSLRFATNLQAASRLTNTYDQYTFTRFVEQMGTDSAPEPPGKINLNYDNLVLTNSQGIASATNFYAWDPGAFFTNTAAKLLADAGYKFAITNIQVWPTNYYTPGVHRLMQLAANIYDATTNRVFAAANDQKAMPYCPTVFRPLFRRLPAGQIVIAGFREVTDHTRWINPRTAPPTLDLQTTGTNAPLPSGTFQDDRTEPMISGVPLVIGAKKGFPNFNEFAMQTHLAVMRLLEFRRDPAQPASTSPIKETNQMYVVSLTNNFGLEAWNPYSNAYPRSLQVIASVDMAATITNQFGTMLASNRPPAYGFSRTYQPGSWRGWSGGNANFSFILPWSTTNQFPFLRSSTYTNSTPGGALGGFVPQTHIFQRNSGFEAPRWVLNLNTKVKFILYDTDAQRIVDYVNLDNWENPLDVFGKLSADYDRNDLMNYTNLANFWITNRQRGSLNPAVPTYGVLNQILACMNSSPDQWRNYQADPTVGNDMYKAVDFFRFNMGSSPRFNTGTSFTKTNVFYAPFSPYHPIYTHVTWQANDPLVHYTIGDLVDESVPATNRVDFDTHVPPLDNIGLINHRFEPWGGGPTSSSNPDIPVTEIAAKDPNVARPDDWDFPTNKFANVGWLGRVHRGTPWQTVYLKSTNILFHTGIAPQQVQESLIKWQKWTGNRQEYFNVNRVDTSMYSNNAVVVDAMFSLPTNDWRLVDLFTTAFNDNASRGRLSVNQTNLASWSAVLAGVNVLQSSKTSTFIEPVGAYDPTKPPPLLRIVDGINATRAKTPTGSFQRLGDILATPELTIASPYITNNAAINDAVVERIPQQIMGLLRGGEPPRFLIYSYGQTLKPAPRSVQTGGTFSGLCTNYTITAEVATRTVVRIVDANTPKPRAVVESFNVLPPD